MPLHCTQPSQFTYVALLNACSRLQDADVGRQTHTDIVQRGLDTESNVYGTLVDMYGKCGSLTEAHQVFKSLPVQNVVSWTALISGYAEQGLNQEILDSYKQMQLEGLHANAVTYVYCLKACATIGIVETGRELHTEIIQKGLEQEFHVNTTLVDMYAKCNLLREARQLFDRLQVKDAVLWTALLAGYVEHGHCEEALSYFNQMQLEGVCGDAVTFILYLKACGTIGALEVGRRLHAKIRLAGLENLSMSNALIDMYGRCGSVTEGRKAFDELLARDAVSWTVLIEGYAENGLNEEVLKCFQQMQLECVSVDVLSLVLGIKACGTIGALEVGRDLHAEVCKKGWDKELYVGNTLVDMYGQCKLLSEAQHVFNRIASQGVVLWTALIAAYVECGHDEEVLNCFNQMQLENVPVDALTLVLCLKACRMLGALEPGQKVHSEIICKGLEEDLSNSSALVEIALVDMYLECGALAESHHVFDRVPDRSTNSWSQLIAKCAEGGHTEEVFSCFKQMQLEGTYMDLPIFIPCLKACAAMGTLETGRQIHAHIAKTGLDKEHVVGNVLIDMYGKCGCVKDGREVFNKLLCRDVISWTAMIKTYGENHEVGMSKWCYEDMQEQGIKPDSVTFTCLLAMCSHASLVHEGQEYFKTMKGQYDIEPTFDHYACMIDLFARAGDISQAESFLRAIEGPPSRDIVMALLSACKVYGELDLGQRCFQQLVEANQEDASAYLLMADIYTRCGKLTEANKLDNTRICAEARKKPGSAIIDLNNKNLHKFVVGVNQSKEMLSLLETLYSCVKGEGYLPNVDLILR